MRRQKEVESERDSGNTSRARCSDSYSGTPHPNTDTSIPSTGCTLPPSRNPPNSVTSSSQPHTSPSPATSSCLLRLNLPPSHTCPQPTHQHASQPTHHLHPTHSHTLASLVSNMCLDRTSLPGATVARCDGSRAARGIIPHFDSIIMRPPRFSSSAAHGEGRRRCGGALG